MNDYEMKIKIMDISYQLLSDKLWAERNRLEEDWRLQKDKAIMDGLPLPKYPQMPVVSQQEVLAVARELENFVSEGLDRYLTTVSTPTRATPTEWMGR